MGKKLCFDIIDRVFPTNRVKKHMFMGKQGLEKEIDGKKSHRACSKNRICGKIIF